MSRARCTHHTRRAQDVRRRSSFQLLIRCHKLTSRGPCTTERRQKGSSPGCGFRERNFPLGYGFPVWKYHRGPPWLSATTEHERSERGGKISDGCRGAQDDPCKNAEMGRSISGQHGCSGDAALPRLRFLYCTEIVVRLLMGERAFVGFHRVVINNNLLVAGLEEGHAASGCVASASVGWPDGLLVCSFGASECCVRVLTRCSRPVGCTCTF